MTILNANMKVVPNVIILPIRWESVKCTSGLQYAKNRADAVTSLELHQISMIDPSHLSLKSVFFRT